jgi:hypothetical protein
MNRAALMTGLAIAAIIGAVGCGTPSTAPSGPCASDEQAAALFYGPPLGVSTSGDTTTYTWGGSKLLFIVDGSTCFEESTS